MKSFLLMKGDCLQKMSKIEDHSVDLILCDLPYGTTACAWDSILDTTELWAHYERLVKPQGAIVLTASQPFTTALIQSKIEWFKYEWIWEKTRATGHAHSKNKPLKKHENILVFSPGTTVHASQSKDRMNYYPQGLRHCAKIQKRKGKQSSAIFSARDSHKEEYIQDKTGYPASILRFASEMSTEHPTQKPVSLMAYLIRTYTQPREVVLDNCMGSGTTGVAALAEKRKFIGTEKDPKYYEVAVRRIKEADKLSKSRLF